MNANITLNIDSSNLGLMEALAPMLAPELARQIVEKMRAEGLVMAPPPPDALVEVAEIREMLGKNGKARSHAWFKRNFIDTELLTLVENPSNRTKQYVSREAAENVLKAARVMPVVKLDKTKFL